MNGVSSIILNVIRVLHARRFKSLGDKINFTSDSEVSCKLFVADFVFSKMPDKINTKRNREREKHNTDQ